LPLSELLLTYGWIVLAHNALFNGKTVLRKRKARCQCKSRLGIWHREWLAQKREQKQYRILCVVKINHL
jgi:hypothetical protein